MKRFSLSFYECEHEGDFDDIRTDICESGGKVISHEINDEAETCHVVIETDNLEEFKTKFKKTNSYSFLN